MKILFFIIILMSCLVNSSYALKLEKKPTANVIVVLDGSGSAPRKEDVFNLTTRISEASKGGRFLHESNPKRLMVIMLDSDSDLVLDRVIKKRADVNGFNGELGQILTARKESVGMCSDVEMALEMAAEAKSFYPDLSSTLIIYSDLVETKATNGKCEAVFTDDTIRASLPYLKGFEMIYLIDVQKRSSWRKALKKEGLKFRFVHKASIHSLDLKSIIKG